jgi:Vitamin B12 dependent methionine synthase, activation domain.
MIEWNDTRPEVNVTETEYKRLLGFPVDYTLEGRSRELAEWAKQWYAENGRPWIYAREVALELSEGQVLLNGAKFAAERLRAQLNDAQASRAVLVSVSAGRQCEERARELWLEGKPDEYFFLEVFGSAVVEHLITGTGARVCAWAEENGMAVLPHYSPGYSGWDTADQNRLFEAIRAGANLFPGDLRVLESGMLQPKKSLLAVFGVTQQVERVLRSANLVPCENCSFSPCQYRRAPYQHAQLQLEDVRRLQPHRNGAETRIVNGSALDLNARYSINQRALRKWSRERLHLRRLEARLIEARFRYEGTTCSNLGRPLAYEYVIKLDGPENGYRIRETACAPAPGDTGHAAMCEYINDGEKLTAAIARECPLAGRPLNDVLVWKRPFSPAACYCDAESRMHKWGLVLEVIHFALARRHAEQATKLDETQFTAVRTL